MIAVDIGNTKTAIAFFRESELVVHRRILTNELATLKELLIHLRAMADNAKCSLAEMGPLVLASVVPPATDLWLGLGRDLDIHLVSPASPLSYKIMLDQPETLGADRIADLEAAVTFFGAPVIVVDAGTATTLNVMNRSREFLGGAIAPGLAISLEALFSKAARVPQVAILPPERVIGRSTEEAIYSGSYFGHAALIKGLVSRIKEELKEPDTKIVFSGGSIPHLEKYLGNEIQYDPLLTLKGLQLIHRNLTTGRN